MTKHTFHYCATHKDDEAYMQQMCSRGWAAVRLVEGFWTFEPCEPEQFCYRICYLRGKTKRETESIIQQCASRDIAFVSRYSFWAIFRSRKSFRLYGDVQELELCRKIYAPMPAGAALSWLLCAAGLFLSLRFSLFFLIPTVLLGLYGAMCTWLALAYHRLLNDLSTR